MDIFLGIDGGGTRTRAAAVNAELTRVGYGHSGSGNPNHVAGEQLKTNLATAADSAVRQLDGCPSDCRSVFAGLAGITTAAARESSRRLLVDYGMSQAQIGIDHDIRIALAGGLGGKPGIALIVGTGSSCYARAADGRTWQSGGWEALISDEGSGYFLGVEAMIAAARMSDGRSPDSSLRTAVFDWLGIAHISEILPRIHQTGLSRAEIAAFAPRVIELAQNGDAAAGLILNKGGQLLAEMVEACYRMLPTGAVPEIVVTGGVGTARTIYRTRIFEAIERLLPAAQIHEPMFPPVFGALLLALEQAGHVPGPELVGRVQALAKQCDD